MEFLSLKVGGGRGVMAWDFDCNWKFLVSAMVNDSRVVNTLYLAKSVCGRYLTIDKFTFIYVNLHSIK